MKKPIAIIAQDSVLTSLFAELGQKADEVKTTYKKKFIEAKGVDRARIAIDTIEFISKVKKDIWDRIMVRLKEMGVLEDYDEKTETIFCDNEHTVVYLQSAKEYELVTTSVLLLKLAKAIL